MQYLKTRLHAARHYRKLIIESEIKAVKGEIDANNYALLDAEILERWTMYGLMFVKYNAWTGRVNNEKIHNVYTTVLTDSGRFVVVKSSISDYSYKRVAFRTELAAVEHCRLLNSLKIKFAILE